MPALAWLRRLGGRTPLLRDLPREVGALAVMAFFVALGFGIVAPIIPVFAREFEVSALQASSVVSAFALVRLVSAPISGTIIDWIGERTTLIAGLLIVAVSSAAAGLSQSFLQLIILRGAGGLGSSMFTVSAMALLIRVVDAGMRGRAVGAYQSGFLFGGLAGPAVGGLVVAVSIRAPFFLYALTLLGAAIVVAITLSHTRLHERAAAKEETGKLEHLGAALRQPAYRAALFVSLVTGFLFYGMRSAAVPLFVTEGLQQPATLVGFGFLASAAVQALLLLPAGRFADVRGRRPAMLIGTIATSVAMAALTVADVASNGWSSGAVIGTVLFFGSMAVQGLGAGFLGSAPAAVVGDVVGGRKGGIVVAVFQMASDLGGVVGPLAAGALIDAWDFDFAFGVSSALALVAVIIVARMPETLRRKPPYDAPVPKEPRP